MVIMKGYESLCYTLESLSEYASASAFAFVFSFAYASVPVSSLTYVNHLRLARFLAMY